MKLANSCTGFQVHNQATSLALGKENMVKTPILAWVPVLARTLNEAEPWKWCHWTLELGYKLYLWMQVEEHYKGWIMNIPGDMGGGKL
jgi:hypothetical protein